MKIVAVSTLQHGASALIAMARSDRVVVTRNGKPVAIVIGMENYDEEDLQLARSPEFWQMIESRRREKTIPFDEAMKQIGVRPSKQSSDRKRKPPRSGAAFRRSKPKRT